jgi:anti-anti-sigma factor
VVTIAGEIDIANVDEFRDGVLVVADGDVVLDMAGVRLLAAVGVGALLDLHRSRALAGSRMVVASASPMVRRVLTLTEVDTVLLMAATVDEAVRIVDGAPRDGRNAVWGKSAVPGARVARPPAPAAHDAATRPRGSIAEELLGESVTSSPKIDISHGGRWRSLRMTRTTESESPLTRG